MMRTTEGRLHLHRRRGAQQGGHPIGDVVAILRRAVSQPEPQLSTGWHPRGTRLVSLISCAPLTMQQLQAGVRAEARCAAAVLIQKHVQNHAQHRAAAEWIPLLSGLRRVGTESVNGAVGMRH